MERTFEHDLLLGDKKEETRYDQLKEYSTYFLKLLGLVLWRGTQVFVLDYLYHLYLDRGEGQEDRSKFYLRWIGAGIVGAAVIHIVTLLTMKYYNKNKTTNLFKDTLVSLEKKLLYIKRRAIMLSTLNDYYQGDLSKEEIIHSYLENLNSEDRLVRDYNLDLEKILSSVRSDELSIISKDLGTEFINVLWRYHELKIMLKHNTVHLSPHRDLRNVTQLATGRILRKTIKFPVIEDIVDVMEDHRKNRIKGQEIAADLDQKKCMIDLKLQYNKYFGFTGLDFEYLYYSESRPFITFTSAVDADGSLVEFSHSRNPEGKVIIEEVKESFRIGNICQN